MYSFVPARETDPKTEDGKVSWFRESGAAATRSFCFGWGREGRGWSIPEDEVIRGGRLTARGGIWYTMTRQDGRRRGHGADSAKLDGTEERMTRYACSGRTDGRRARVGMREGACVRGGRFIPQDSIKNGGVGLENGKGFYRRETCIEASIRTGLSEGEIRECFANGTLWWQLNRKRGVYEVVGDACNGRRGEGVTLREGPGAGEDVGSWMLDFLIGKKFGDGVILSIVWVLLFVTCMWPFTLMGLAFEYMVRGDASMVGQAGKNEYLTGGGMFDEISSRRREDLQWMLGIGKYEGRGY